MASSIERRLSALEAKLAIDTSIISEDTLKFIQLALNIGRNLGYCEAVLALTGDINNEGSVPRSKLMACLHDAFDLATLTQEHAANSYESALKKVEGESRGRWSDSYNRICKLEKRLKEVV